MGTHLVGLSLPCSTPCICCGYSSPAGMAQPRALLMGSSYMKPQHHSQPRLGHAALMQQEQRVPPSLCSTHACCQCSTLCPGLGTSPACCAFHVAAAHSLHPGQSMPIHDFFPPWEWELS